MRATGLLLLQAALLLAAALGQSSTGGGSSCGDSSSAAGGRLQPAASDVVLVLIDRLPAASALPQRTHQLLQTYVRATLAGGVGRDPASSTRLAICRFGRQRGLRALTAGGFTASATEASAALALALVQDAAAATTEAGGDSGASASSTTGVIAILDAAAEALLSHPGLSRRPSAPQAVLVVGAVDGTTSEEAAAAAAAGVQPLNLRKPATPVDVAAADVFHAALQLRNTTARAMAEASSSSARRHHGSPSTWFPAQDTLRMAFLLSGGGGAGRIAAEAALGEPYFGHVASSEDGGEVQLGVAVKLTRLVRERAPSRSLQVRKTRLLHHFMLKTITITRQARDKHRKTQRDAFSSRCGCSRRVCGQLCGTGMEMATAAGLILMIMLLTD
jgi:hypothetical protein|eukprot:COSAG06_NODE_48_length_29046_cov_7.967181_11_plen_389_part_00